jgi:hypothetical protein
MIDFDTASPSELMRESREMARKAAETANTWRWAQDQQAAAVKRSISIPVAPGAIDWEEAGLTRKRAQARKLLDNALAESGLTKRWQLNDEAERDRADYLAGHRWQPPGPANATLQKLMGLGSLLSNKR